MASTPPTDDKAKAVPVAAVKPASAPKADATPIAKSDTTKSDIGKIAPKPTEAVKAAVEAVAVPVIAAVEAVTKPVSAAVATPPAKKAVAKPAPVTAKTKIVARKIVKTIKPAVAKAKTVVTKEVNVMEAQIKNAAEKAKTMLTDANAKGTKAFGEVNDFTKGNIEAMVESGKIAAKGLETLGQDNAEFARKQFESATATLKTLSTVKSPTDFFKLQGDYMRTYFDSLVAQSSQNTEKLLKLAGDVAQPIQNRVSVAVEKVKIAA